MKKKRVKEAAGFDWWAGMRIRGYTLLEATARRRSKGGSGLGCRMERERRREGPGGRLLAVGEEAICRCCRPVERNWLSSL